MRVCAVGGGGGGCILVLDWCRSGQREYLVEGISEEYIEKRVGGSLVEVKKRYREMGMDGSVSLSKGFKWVQEQMALVFVCECVFSWGGGCKC